MADYKGEQLAALDVRLMQLADRMEADGATEEAGAIRTGCAFIREAWDGGTLGDNQRISAREALTLYTTSAAYATGEEHVKGKLTPGYYADFVVLGDNPLTVDPKRLSQIPVLATYVAGERVWGRDE